MKRMLDRITALLCALCLLLAPVCTASEEEGEPAAELLFSDVSEEDWFYGPVRFLAEQGLLQGFGDGTFRPRDTLTEAQLLKLLLKPYMPEDMEEPAGEGWWIPYWEFGVREGILAADDLEHVHQGASRLRTAQLLARLPLLPVSEEDLLEPDTVGILAEICDLDEIPREVLDAVVTVYASGIMEGYDDGCFHPERVLTRAEGAAVIQRLMLPDLRRPKLRRAVPETWFEDALLLGNSHCGGISMYGELPQPDICFSYGGTFLTGLGTLCRDRHERSFTMRSLLQSRQYGKIILIFGTNEMGYDMEYLRPRLEEFLDRLVELQPQARLWLCTAPPVNPELAENPELEVQCFTVENCLAVNGLLRAAAEERGLGLIDVFSLFADENGILPREYTGDGIHLTMACYRTWGQWLASAVLPAEEGAAEEEGPPAEEENPEVEETPAEEESPEEEGPPTEEENPQEEAPLAGEEAP